MHMPMGYVLHLVVRRGTVLDLFKVRKTLFSEHGVGLGLNSAQVRQDLAQNLSEQKALFEPH